MWRGRARQGRQLLAELLGSLLAAHQRLARAKGVKGLSPDLIEMVAEGVSADDMEATEWPAAMRYVLERG